MKLKKKVENILQANNLYLSFVKMDAYMGCPQCEEFEIGPKTNYSVTSGTLVAISENPKSVKVKLEDVLFEGVAPLVGESSNYDISITDIIEEDGRVKVSGKLASKIGILAVPSKGKDYTGQSFAGYVKKIEKGPLKVQVKLPDFDF